MKSIRHLIAVILLPISSVVAAAQTANRGVEGSVLAPGDLLRIAVWQHPEFSGDFVVAPDGTITHPLYRSVKVTGISQAALEEKLRQFLGTYAERPAFVASPLMRVFAGGEVRQPNVYNVPPGTTVTQIIALAGGPSERGNLENVALKRYEGTTILNLTAADPSAAVTETHSGDQIIVSRRHSLFNDVIVPSASVMSAVGVLVSIFLQARN